MFLLLYRCLSVLAVIVPGNAYPVQQASSHKALLTRLQVWSMSGRREKKSVPPSSATELNTLTSAKPSL